MTVSNSNKEKAIAKTTRSKKNDNGKQESQVTVDQVQDLMDNQDGEALNIQVRDSASQLALSRPVTPGKLQVAETFTEMGGNRPVFSSGMKIAGTINASGNRPIAASTLKVSETYQLMGNRPIASNEIDDPDTLMGYID
ncbi:hypothetical protein [Oscillatoria salina]|uniref:hypothetical protein n=1 Tax=Oscillatoria salina TaxID=331517 RepID=UPI001CC900BC|nr:hypothetical protein [Oscillatoria salina]MBZ8179120.1 hypothetical protein [Oscillatoria salina IIICB1]